MSKIKVYELIATSPEDAQLWQDTETRSGIIEGGIELAREKGCQVLRVLDANGNQLYVEGFQLRAVEN